MAKALQSPGSFLALMLEKYKLNPFKLSKDIHLSQSAVRLITIGKTKITTPVALRLAKYFNTNPEFWLAMQMKWDIAEASKDKALTKIVKGIPRVKKASAGGSEKKAATAKKSAAKKKATAKKATKKTPKKAVAKKPRLQKKAAPKKRAVAKRSVAAKRKPAVRKAASARKGARKKATVRKPVKAGRKPAASRTRTAARRRRTVKK